MARKSLIARNEKRIKLYEKYRAKRKEYFMHEIQKRAKEAGLRVSSIALEGPELEALTNDLNVPASVLKDIVKGIISRVLAKQGRRGRGKRITLEHVEETVKLHKGSPAPAEKQQLASR